MNQLAHQFSEHPGREELYQNENLEQRKNTGLEATANNSSINIETLLEENESYAEIEDFSYQDEAENTMEEYMSERCIPISTERGKTGPFDVEELVKLLEEENGVDIRVLDIAPELRFVDHMVIVTGKSLRHMRAMAASVEWLYKKKRASTDRQFKLEGRDCKDWFAMDLGNIAVHIFKAETRQHYDLETLWTLGPEFDDPRHYADNETTNLSPAEQLWLENTQSENTVSTDESTQDKETQHA
ncbi:hypothetical protein C0Q70_00920 [Pomacea canaliculata]|uniref:Mitochondrial assembly of ribosomal large subunit protein 1 n=2 Tax=Pomacea canaliculata TaxID=400727 RepID=A0A2T7PY21_POMCA|nr:hypothetical protein C0Q70_00920 [Pomacea canaliculata]